MFVTLALSVRVLINAEALNMAESVGNYTRHRKAPVVISTETGYSVVYAPAVSGESLAHGYQQLLAQLAKARNLPVTRLDEQGYFLKFSSREIFDTWYPELARIVGQPKASEWVNKASLEEIERAFLTASVVADIGGFLFAERLLKRTSTVKFSYMVPTLDALEGGGVAVTPQLHVRYAPPEMLREQKEEERERVQALFYVESGSALYTFTAELLASDISKLFYAKQPDPVLEKQKRSRVELAVDALISLLDGLLFGAKRSRYMPLWDVQSLVATVSSGPAEFIPTPGLTKSYVKETYERAVALTNSITDETVAIYAYVKEKGVDEPSVNPGVKRVVYTKCSSHTEALVKAKEQAVSLLFPQKTP